MEALDQESTPYETKIYILFYLVEAYLRADAATNMPPVIMLQSQTAMWALITNILNDFKAIWKDGLPTDHQDRTRISIATGFLLEFVSKIYDPRKALSTQSALLG